jgi:F-type H+-transporting ATPase subunit gamma
LYAEQKVDSVYIIFSEFKSVIAPNLAIEKLLPVEAIREEKTGKDTNEAGRSDNEPGKSTETQVDYIYEQPEGELLNKLLPRYIETQILRAMLESSASEYAARMTAMESATKNAGDVIEALTLHMNKVRQAAITKEIIEIVSGASYGT